MDFTELIFLFLLGIVFSIILVTKLLPGICWQWSGYVGNLLAEGVWYWELTWDSSVTRSFPKQWGLSSVCKATAILLPFFHVLRMFYWTASCTTSNTLHLPPLHKPSPPEKLGKPFLKLCLPSHHQSQSSRYLIPQPKVAAASTDLFRSPQTLGSGRENTSTIRFFLCASVQIRTLCFRNALSPPSSGKLPPYSLFCLAMRPSKRKFKSHFFFFLSHALNS